MKGWLFTKTHEPLVLTEKADPVAQKGQVVVDIKASGLCLSDIHVLEDESYMNIATGAPCYIGHECAGIVESVGEGVTNVKVGDRVAVDHTVNALTNECIGFTQDGGYATKILVNDYQCVLMPDKVTFAQAASSTCAGLTAYHAVFTMGGVKPGTRVGMIGIGGLGQYAVGMAAAKGAEVYASSRSQKGKDLATSLGAKHVASTMDEFIDEKLEVVIDFAGSRKTLNDAIRAVRFGGTVVEVGMMEKDLVIEDVSSVNGLILKEVVLKGCCGGTGDEIPGIFELIQAGKYTPILKEISFDDIEEGLQMLRDGKVEGKLVAVQD